MVYSPERAGMSEMSELWLVRLTKSLKSPVLLDAGAFSKLKMSESQPPRLTKSLKSVVLLDAGAFPEFKMSELHPHFLAKR